MKAKEEEQFLSRKVCKSVGEIARGEREFMTIGNMEAKRDFGYAKEYVEWIWNIMQYDTPQMILLFLRVKLTALENG